MPAAVLADSMVLLLQRCDAHIGLAHEGSKARGMSMVQQMQHSTGDGMIQNGNGAQGLVTVLDRLVHNVGVLLGIPSCSVALLEPETGDLVTWSALNAGPEGPRRTRFRPNEGVAGWVAAHMRPLLVNNAASEPRFKPLGDAQIGSLLCVPLMDGDQLLGTLTVTSPQAHAFDERRQQLLQVFADQAVLAITKARQAEEAQVQAAELGALLDASQALTSSLDTRQFFGHIVASIRRVAACEDAVIYAFDEHAEMLRVVAGLGRRVERLGGAHIPLADPESIAAWVAKQRRPRLFSPGRAATGEVTEAFLSGDQLGLLCVPLVSKERLRGVITLARTFAFTPGELRRMLHLANIVAAALENVELYQTARTEREQQAAIFAAGSDGIAIVDATLSILEANDAFARLVGVPHAALQGMNCCALLCQEGAECGLCQDGKCLVNDALQSGQALPHVSCELLAPTSGHPLNTLPGQSDSRGRPSHPPAQQPVVRYVDLSITPVSAPQGRRVLLIGRDMTALREMDLMKANFLSMVSHELRSPLQAINGYLDVTLSGMAGELTTEQHEFIRRARAGSEHLTALVDDLLLISRRDAGQFHLGREIITLDRVLEEAREEMELVALDAGVAIAIQRQPGLPPIYADGPRLQQVLRNLLTNAIKFTPRGGQVTVSATSDGEHVRLSVRDTGIGIAAEHLPRIFDRFYQVQNDSARGQGQGLGLAIVRIIVEGHGGRVDVQSQPRFGSTFTVMLPLQIPTSAPDADD
jgi:signal transduction histidine kinase/GAF domain-containing protein